MNRYLAAMIAVLLIPLLLLGHAFAQEANPALTGDTVVVLPWGDWLTVLLANYGEIILGVIGILIARLVAILPKPVADWFKTKSVEQLLDRAVDYGLEAVSGAAKGRQLSISVGSEVVAVALRYVIDHGAGKLIAWMGGPELIKEKILARLDLAPEAEAAHVLVAADAVVIAGKS